jgi:enoyl-CoA hydratase/carnithine racemase
MTCASIASIAPERRVRTMQRNGIALLEMDRPAARNALDDALVAELTAEIHRLQGNRALRALIITGAGQAFCSGNDMKAIAKADAVQFAHTIRLQQKLSMTLLDFDKPIVAALNGPALGAGLALALNCDIRVATTDFYCSTPGIRLGLTPTNGASILMPLLTGPSRARRLLLTGMRVNAQWCLRVGLVDELTTSEDLLPRAVAIAEEFSTSSFAAVGATRRLLTTVLKDTFAAVLRAETSACLAAREADGVEAVKAFLADQPGAEASIT